MNEPTNTNTEAELKSQRMAAESVSGSQTALKQLHLARLIQFADFVADNPAMTRRVLQEADAFAEHYLIGVTHRALELDIYLPVAVTAAAWIQWIAVPGDREEELDRLFSMLGRMKCVVKERLSLDERFHITALTQTGQEEQAEVRVIVGRDEKGEHVITLMLGHEELVWANG